MMNFIACFSERRYFKRACRLFLCSFLLLAGSACRKDNNFYLNGSLPGGNMDVQVIPDTLTLLMHTERRPAVRTDLMDTLLAGSVNDPVFGRTTAIAYSQMLLYTFARPDINSKSRVDSTVLTLRLGSNITGDARMVQTWKVYQMGEDLLQNMPYYSDTTLKTGDLLGTFTGSFDGKESISFRLNSLIASKIIADSGRSLTDNASFAALLKGIVLVPDSSETVGKGAIIPLNLASDTSNITLFYHNDTAARQYKMIFGANAVKVNRYTHDYRNTPVETQLKAPKTQFGQVYTQNMGGLRIRVEAPYLNTLVRQGYVLLNQAQFLFPVTDTAGFSGAAPLMNVATRDSAGFSLPYSAMYPSAAYNYLYLSSRKLYMVVLTRDIQSLLKQIQSNSGYKGYGFNLSPPMSPAALWQTVIAGPGHPGTKSKLILTFTKAK